MSQETSGLKIWTLDDFEIEFGINLAEECEASTNQADYYHLEDGRSLEIVKVSSIVKIDGLIVGRIEE